MVVTFMITVIVAFVVIIGVIVVVAGAGVFLMAAFCAFSLG